MVPDLYDYAKEHCKYGLKQPCLQLPCPCFPCYPAIHQLGTLKLQGEDWKIGHLAGLKSLLSSNMKMRGQSDDHILQKPLMGLKTNRHGQGGQHHPSVSATGRGPHQQGVPLHPEPPRHWANGELPKEGGGLPRSISLSKGQHRTPCKGNSPINGRQTLAVSASCRYMTYFIFVFNAGDKGPMGTLEGSGASLILAIFFNLWMFSTRHTPVHIQGTAHLTQQEIPRGRVFPLSRQLLLYNRFNWHITYYTQLYDIRKL